MDAHLGYEKHEREGGERRANTRNGTTLKTLKGPFGELAIDTPRERAGKFEPQRVKKLSELLKRYNSNLCFHTGQAPTYNKITIENIAINSFMREVIDPKKPVADCDLAPFPRGNGQEKGN